MYSVHLSCQVPKTADVLGAPATEGELHLRRCRAMHPLQHLRNARPCRVEAQQVNRVVCVAFQGQVSCDLANHAAEFEAVARAGRADNDL